MLFHRITHFSFCTSLWMLSFFLSANTSASSIGYGATKIKASYSVNDTFFVHDTEQIDEEDEITYSHLFVDVDFNTDLLKSIRVDLYSPDSYFPSENRDSDTNLFSLLVSMASLNFMYEEMSFGARYKTTTNDRIRSSDRSYLEQGEEFFLSTKIQRFRGYWGAHQRNNLDKPWKGNRDKTRGLIGVSYYRVPATGIWKNTGVIEKEIFNSVGIDLDFSYLSTLGKSPVVFSIGSQNSLMVGGLLGIDTGYFAQLGYAPENSNFRFSFAYDAPLIVSYGLNKSKRNGSSSTHASRDSFSATEINKLDSRISFKLIAIF